MVSDGAPTSTGDDADEFGIPEVVYRLPIDDRNTARPTRSRFEYQDECAAWWVLQRLRSEDLLGVVVESPTDFVMLSRSGDPELVSVKHRDPNRSSSVGWTIKALREDRVLVGLYRSWSKADMPCSVAFVSNSGVEGPEAKAIHDACMTRRAEDHQRATGILINRLGLPPGDASEFLSALEFLRDPLPARTHITDGNVQRTQEYLSAAGRSGRWAYESYIRLMERIREASTEVPAVRRSVTAPAPVAATLRDLNRKLRHDDIGRRYLSAAELRKTILAASDGHEARDNRTTVKSWESDPLFTGRKAELAQALHALRLGEPDRVAPVVLHGVTGCGKTTLALEVAARSSGSLVPVVINVENRAALIHGLNELAGASSRDVPGAGTLPRQGGPVTPMLPDNPSMLLILDGVQDREAIRGIISRQNLCRILITTQMAHVDDGYLHIEIAD